MDIITMESAAFDHIMAKIDRFELELKKTLKASSYPLNERWIETEALCKIFRCSKRTIQTYREEFMLPFTSIKSRYYFKASDVENFFNQNYQIIRENQVTPQPKVVDKRRKKP